MKTLLHVDDLYQDSPESFSVLRDFLSQNGLILKGIGRFADAERAYGREGWPEVIIMDILNEDAGVITAEGVKIATAIEESNQSSIYAPCVIYYTGVDENDASIKKIRRRDPFGAQIVFKTRDALADAKAIYKCLPTSMKQQI